MIDIFERLESEIRSYCRAFPTVFRSAKGSYMTDRDGRSYLDFFAGAGVLNYGHNNDHFKQALIDYLSADGITHSLDMYTEAKAQFLNAFERHILKPRNMNYRIQFTGPTGTNAVESAFKVARKATGRSDVVFFTNGFHGLTLGSLAATGNEKYRQVAGATLTGATQMPFDKYHGAEVNTADMIRRYLEDASSGYAKPAAMILETVQAEGGVHVASAPWLRDVAAIAREQDILLIADDIQVGCGRTGSYFSFEEAGIEPDIICLSKSLSGYGLPMAIVLIKPEYDVWEPGEHTGTFRGHNPAFVTARRAIETYWHDDAFARQVGQNSEYLRGALEKIAAPYAERGVSVRGRGFIQGVDLVEDGLAGKVTQLAFERGLIIETAGAADQVVKCLAPLTIERDDLDRGLAILADCIPAALEQG